MNRKTLLLFIERILENGSQGKAETSLRQLKSILVIQNADPKLIRLVDQTLLSVPEAKEEAEKSALSEESIEIAFKRAEQRKERERMMEMRGRC